MKRAGAGRDRKVLSEIFILIPLKISAGYGGIVLDHTVYSYL
jgi:hypothetical protein